MAKRKRKTSATPAGPFTAHACIDCAIVKRGGEVFQQCRTLEGARSLAALLNDAVGIAERYGPAIVSTRDPGEIVASALARAFDWQLELPSSRQFRQLCKGGAHGTA